MKKKNVFLILLTAAFVLTAGIENTLAYFTTYTEASGGYTIHLGDRTTEIEEEFTEWKNVYISNGENSVPVYVRVKAFCGSEYNLVYDTGDKWSLNVEDGYYYYSDILNGGETTDKLLIKVDDTSIPKDIKDVPDIHVVVIYESTPVRYDKDNKPYADWSVILDTGETQKGGTD